MRVIIAGSRDRRMDGARLWPVLDASPLLAGASAVLSGACSTGADAAGEGWARRRGLELERHPADWSQGRGAGPARNARMVARADGLVALLDDANPCRGTRDVIRRARAAGLAVEVYTVHLEVV